MQRGKKLYLTLASVAAVILLTAAVYSSVTPDKNVSILKKHQFIGHAFGAIDGHVYTNSLEAFKTNYEKGRRVFEVDFSITSDGFVVCFHDGKEEMYGLEKYIWDTSRLEFKKSKILGQYTPLDIFDLVRIMREHTDIYIVTDVKRSVSAMSYALTMLVLETHRIDDEITNRIIPQVYDEGTYYETMKVYPFPEIIYTLYRTRSSDAKVIDFLKLN